MEDPCNAPLVNPCYSSGGGGTVLIRLELDQILYAGATETAGIYTFVPGLGAAWINATPLPSDTTGTLVAGANAAGSSWLLANAASFRPVAACMQVMYPGSELTRAGIIGISVVPANTIQPNFPAGSGGNGSNTTAALTRASCAHTERMPATLVEAKWSPGEQDQTPTTPTLPLLVAATLQGRNAIMMSASGFPVSTGIRVRTVAVYEASLLTTVNTGQVQSVAPPKSQNTANQVLRDLFSRDPEWWLNSALKTGRMASSVISYAAAGAKAAGRIVNGMAMIAA